MLQQTKGDIKTISEYRRLNASFIEATEGLFKKVGLPWPQQEPGSYRVAGLNWLRFFTPVLYCVL